MSYDLRLDGDTLIYDHPPPSPEIQREAQLAIDCQDACNACGVAQALAAAALTINRDMNPIGTELVNQHPIVWLFADKLMTLQRSGHVSSDTFEQNYRLCRELAAGRPVTLKIVLTSKEADAYRAPLRRAGKTG